jgi:steroid delta-isomerase-like uncharacterized protein
MRKQLGSSIASFTLLLSLVGGCQPPVDSGPEVENEATARAFYEALDANDFDAFDDLTTTDFQLFMAGAPSPMSLGELKEVIPVYYNAFPDYNHTIRDVISTGDKVVVHATATGTHQSEFEGLPPTGRTIEYEQIGIFRFVENRIVEAWVVEDNLTMMTQLGMQLVPGEAEG